MFSGPGAWPLLVPSRTCLHLAVHYRREKSKRCNNKRASGVAKAVSVLVYSKVMVDSSISCH